MCVMCMKCICVQAKVIEIVKHKAKKKRKYEKKTIKCWRLNVGSSARYT